MLMKSDRSMLLVVDMQEKLARVIDGIEAVEANTAILMQAAARLSVPMLVSEQYPKGIGTTVPALADLAAEGATVEKVHFSCVAEPDFGPRIDGLGRDQAIVCGIEAHVCVLQTAMDLLETGRPVFVVEDATGSRTPANHRAAMERLRAAGAGIVTTEMVVFEWMHRAGTPEFKDVSKLIK